VAAQELDQLIVHSLDDGLRRGQAGRDLGAQKPGPDTLDEVLDDLEVDVGLEQCQADLAQTGVHVLRPEHAPAGDLLERRSEALAKRLKHFRASPAGASGRSARAPTPRAPACVVTTLPEGPACARIPEAHG